MRSVTGILVIVFSMLLLTNSANASIPCQDEPRPAATLENRVDEGGSAKPKANPTALRDIPEIRSEIQQLKDLIQTESQELATQRAKLAEEQEKLQREEQRVTALEEKIRADVAKEPPGAPENGDSGVGTAAQGIHLALPSESVSTSPTSQSVLSKTSDPAPQSLGAQPEVFSENHPLTFGPFAINGDFRLRSESTFGGPPDNSLTRTREEFRLRTNIDVKLNKDFDGGFSFASGDVNNPISTNQTTNQFFTRKPFEIDRAFIDYHPSGFQPLMLIGGKFAYPWYNTELTWDKDINPEGVAQKLAFDTRTSVLRNVTLVAFELPFAETAGIALANKSITQSIVYGSQIQTTWKLSNWLTFGGYSGYYNWHGADAVALAVETADSASPLDGLLALNSNHAQNSMTTTTATTVITDGPNVFPTGVRKVSGAQFASKFGLFDSIARFDIKTPQERWPIAFIGDFVQNTKACANVGNIAPPPANTSTQTYSQTANAPCDPNQRRGYWLEASYGRTKEKGDWQFSYTRLFIEREAVLSVFNYSELWQGSNIEFHRGTVSYQAYRNVQLLFTALLGRPLVTSSSPAPALNILKRLQFDVIYTF